MRNLEQPTPLLEVRVSTLNVAGRTLLENFQLQLFPHEIIRLNAPNGSGKSTLLRALVGHHFPDVLLEAKIFFEAQEITKLLGRSLSERLVYVGSRITGGEGFTVHEAMELTREFAYQPITEHEIKSIYQALGIEEILSKTLSILSMGEYQRYNLAKSLLLNPRVLFLDESLSHLDSAYLSQATQILETWVKTHERAILYVNHAGSLPLRSSPSREVNFTK